MTLDVDHLPMELALNKWRRENKRRRRAKLPELELPDELQAYVDRRDTALVVQQRFDLSRDEWWGRAEVLERVGRGLPLGHEVLCRPISLFQLHLQRTEWATLEAALRARHPEFILAERKVRPNTKQARLAREVTHE